MVKCFNEDVVVCSLKRELEVSCPRAEVAIVATVCSFRVDLAIGCTAEDEWARTSTTPEAAARLPRMVVTRIVPEVVC